MTFLSFLCVLVNRGSMTFEKNQEGGTIGILMLGR
jgi:hypothetical protein